MQTIFESLKRDTSAHNVLLVAGKSCTLQACRVLQACHEHCWHVVCCKHVMHIAGMLCVASMS